MDVDAETVAIAIAEPDGEVRSLGNIKRIEPIGKLIKKLGPVEKLRGCYEDGRLAMYFTGSSRN